MIQELLDLKSNAKKGKMKWGECYSMPTENGLVCHIGFMDGAFVIMMSSYMTGDEKTLIPRHRPKETAANAPISREPFGDEAVKDLWVTKVSDCYNHTMGAVDVFDQLTAQNAGLRRVVRGGHQALEHWLLRVVSINCCVLFQQLRLIGLGRPKLRSQREFRISIIEGLIVLGRSTYRSPKRRVSLMSQDADNIPLPSHQMVKRETRGQCIACKGGRFSDRPKKRVALKAIAANTGRDYAINLSSYGCKQCDVWLCKKRSCFDVFHRNEENWPLCTKNPDVLIGQNGSLRVRTVQCKPGSSRTTVTYHALVALLPPYNSSLVIRTFLEETTMRHSEDCDFLTSHALFLFCEQ